MMKVDSITLFCVVTSSGEILAHCMSRQSATVYRKTFAELVGEPLAGRPRVIERTFVEDRNQPQRR